MFLLEIKNVLTRLKIFTTLIRFLKNNCTINSILSIYTYKQPISSSPSMPAPLLNPLYTVKKKRRFVSIYYINS